MADRWQAVVGRVHLDPTDAWTEKADPGVGRVHTPKLGLAGRRIGLKITAHVTSGQPDRSKARDFEMDEILANAAALPEYLGDRRAHLGCGRVEIEVFMDSAGAVQHDHANRLRNH